jgi:hypothetical protein
MIVNLPTTGIGLHFPDAALMIPITTSITGTNHDRLKIVSTTVIKPQALAAKNMLVRTATRIAYATPHSRKEINNTVPWFTWYLTYGEVLWIPMSRGIKKIIYDKIAMPLLSCTSLAGS